MERVRYWFLIFLSAATQSLQKGFRFDPCTPKGYSHNVQSLKLAPDLLSEKHLYQPTLQTRGNFSECRSAAAVLLQKGKGLIYLHKFVLLVSFIIGYFSIFCFHIKSFIIFVIDAEKCSHQRCDIGSTFLPKLQGKFLATENFFHASKVCVLSFCCLKWCI